MALAKVFPGRVIFDHLPKTAGQAINAWLVNELGAGCVTPNLIGSHQELIQRYGGQYCVISGHISFHDEERLDPRYQYITFFRDPVDRVVSWLYFVVNNHSESELGELMSLAKRFLDSDGLDLPNALVGHICNLYVNHFCRVMGNGHAPDNEKVENAFSALQSYDVVGTYGDMSGFLADVASLIGLPTPSMLAPVNVTTKRPRVEEVSTALRERIIGLNQLDIALYERVLDWKKSSASCAVSMPMKTAERLWCKYEPVRERVLTTPDLSILKASLREGYYIRHGEMMTFDVDFFLACDVRNLETGIHIFDCDRRWAFGTNNTLLEQFPRPLTSGSFCVSHHLIADLPAGQYTAGFAFAERTPEASRELAWHDALCTFQVLPPSGKTFAGYTYLPAQMYLIPTSLAVPEHVVDEPVGELVVTTSVSSMLPGSSMSINVEITNRSEQVWVGDSIRPVSLSYHWLRESGEVMVFDGVRTPIPPGGIRPGQKCEATMNVEAPSEAGTYILELTLIQERVMWFEEKGFRAARLQVNVVAIDE